MKQLLPLSLLFLAQTIFAQTLSVSELGRYTDGNDGACEISAYDATTEQIFTTNSVMDAIDIVDVSNSTMPTLLSTIDITPYGGGINSVINLENGYIAAAIEDTIKQNPGKVVFFEANGGAYAGDITVGALPDMLVMTPDGNKILVANEGEPDDDYLIDPEGSISVINISNGIGSATVSTIDFSSAGTISGGLQKPNTTWAEDLEPEYIAVNDASTLAVVVCQENNVFVFIDLTTNTVQSYKGLGFKDHSIAGNGLDISNDDNGVNIGTWIFLVYINLMQ